MKLISWNVNGLRALHRKGYWSWFEETQPDVLCLQEIKAEEIQLPPEVQKPEGFHASFNSSRERKGYSGVATYSKEGPLEVNNDALPERFNTQGRVIESRFKNFVLLNGYFPNGGGGPDKLSYKLDFYDAFLAHIEKLRSNGDSIIFCGDLNVSHEEIDVHNPLGKDDHILFLPDERAWMDEVVALGCIDTFRHFHPTRRDAYTWWDMRTRARETNTGWRIDYFFVSQDLQPMLKSADVLMDVYGSDHCPISLELI